MRSSFISQFIGLPFALLLVVLPSRAQEIRVAAAADLKFAMQDLAAQFQKNTGTAVDVTYGSSGNFFSQLQNGAPFDIFFSADVDYVVRLKTLGLTDPGSSFFTYAIGRIAIWMPPESEADPAHQAWHAILNSKIHKIAIANPDHAPYGRAAVAALKKAGLYERIKPKLVYGENIAQAAQFVQSGNAQAGIIALSLALSPAMKRGKLWEIPEDQHPPIEQAAVILRDAKNKESARAFCEFVTSEPGRATLVKYGFAMPHIELPTAPKK